MSSENKIIIAPQPGRQELAMNVNADVIIYGGAKGSGKSHLLLMRPLLHINDPNFGAVIFRRTQEALKKPGAVWPESKKMYRPFNTAVDNSARKHTFPSGATMLFDGLKDVGVEEVVYHGAQLSFVGFDEVNDFEESQVMFMLSRLRSDAENDAYALMTCNPDPDSWLLKWVQPYLDEQGYPIRELGGKIRYFITIDESPIFSDTREWLQENYPDHCTITDPDGVAHDVVSTYTFIDGTIYDNPALRRKEPRYLAKLKGQSRVNQAKFLHGNWYAREEASGYWKREWCEDKKPPLGCKACRAYDKAGTVPSEVYRNPDYTASIKMLKDKDGYYYIQGNWIPEFKDEGTNILGKFRKRVGDRDALITKQAIADGQDVHVVFPKEGGQAGLTEFTESSKKLISEGFVVKADPMPNNKNKLTKFSPFASACENGLVFIDKSSFPNEETYNDFCKELEQMDGERSTAHRKDDRCDSCASAFNYLNSMRVVPEITLNGIYNQRDHITRYRQAISGTNPNFGDSIMNKGGHIV